MDQKYQTPPSAEKQLQSNQQYYGQPPPPIPLQYGASAPEYPTPPPQYSVSEPTFSYPNQPFIPQQEQPYVIQQQPQVQHVVMLQIPLGSSPVNTTCPGCQSTIITKVKSEPNIATHSTAVILCVVFLPCAILPYCMPSCQTSVHTCPNCSAFIGAYRPGRW